MLFYFHLVMIQQVFYSLNSIQEYEENAQKEN